MAQFFRHSIDQQQFIGSRERLETERLRYRKNQVSGVFEIQATPDELQVLVLGDGEETGAYCLYPNSRVKINPLEIGTGWVDHEVPIRMVAIPDHASRAIWQSLEYPVVGQETLPGLTGWKDFLETCRKHRLTGLVRLDSDLCDGFVFLQEGLPAPGETILCSSDGFTTSLQAAEAFLDAPERLTIYKADPATQAYQCTFLRLGAVGWGKRILAHYKDMVGQKLLHILNVNLNSMLMHQQSNIYLADIDIVDNHFFVEPRTAAEVYQSLFQNMSQLIGRVIGNMVTRRIMSTTFERLALSEREVLTSNTLAPATFLR